MNRIEMSDRIWREDPNVYVSHGKRVPRSKNWELIFSAALIPGVKQEHDFADILRAGGKFRVSKRKNLLRIWKWQTKKRSD